MTMEGQKMDNKEYSVTESVQPKVYSNEELQRLKEFVETVKNDEARSALACWGNHDDYSHGY